VSGLTTERLARNQSPDQRTFRFRGDPTRGQVSHTGTSVQQGDRYCQATIEQERWLAMTWLCRYSVIK